MVVGGRIERQKKIDPKVVVFLGVSKYRLGRAQQEPAITLSGKSPEKTKSKVSSASCLT